LPGRQGGDEAIREEGDDHPWAEHSGLRVVREAHVGDLADLQAEEGHRRAYRQPTNRLAEIEHVAALDRIGLLHRDAAVAIQRELEFGRGRFGVSGRKLRHVEGHPACEQRRDGFGADVDAIRTERDVDPAHVPEARAGGDVLVVRRMDEDRDVDRLASARVRSRSPGRR
jgi:hypothetical protein